MTHTVWMRGQHIAEEHMKNRWRVTVQSQAGIKNKCCLVLTQKHQKSTRSWLEISAQIYDASCLDIQFAFQNVFVKRKMNCFGIRKQIPGTAWSLEYLVQALRVRAWKQVFQLTLRSVVTFEISFSWAFNHPKWLNVPEKLEVLFKVFYCSDPQPCAWKVLWALFDILVNCHIFYEALCFLHVAFYTVRK